MKLFAVLSVFSASVEACGGTVNEYQSITSPGYPSFYENNLDCTWNIELGDVPGFVIVKNHFDVEYTGSCGFDYLKVIANFREELSPANGNEQNFCHSEYDYSNSETYPDHCNDTYSSSSSSSTSSYVRKRRSGEAKMEEGKFTPDLVNVSNDGFPDQMYIIGGSATIRFVTDYCLRHKGFDLSIEPFSIPSRFEIIEFHARRVVESVAKAGWNWWGRRYASRMEKILKRLQRADTGVSCYEENFPGEAADEEDQLTVFDADNMCKLNGQVNAALNSYARHNACDGRGKVYRQIIRSARKVKKFFSDKNNC